LITSVLSLISDEYFRCKHSDQVGQTMASISSLAEKLLRPMMAIFKKDVWFEEGEIRWIIDLDNSEKLKYMIQLAPRSIDSKINTKGEMPIVGVTFGPASDTSANRIKVESLLSTTKLKGKTINSSQIPLIIP
jgi:hypothetical protein